MKTNQNAILLCSIQKDDTDEILKNEMIKMESMLASILPTSGFLLSISGYEQDSRELWEIPEMKILATRLVNIGFISLLDLSTIMKSLKDPDPLYKTSLGALEVWALSKGILNGKHLITKNQYQLFLEDLNNANTQCDKVTRWKSKSSYNK
jgi:hypothetical protein